MSIRISPIVSASRQPIGLFDWVRSVDVRDLDPSRGPVRRLDHFRITSSATGPRLGAGASALTYVLRDSDTPLRLRDSLGHDLQMRPGGLLWMRAGSGVAHEHLPVDAGQRLHCLHLCLDHRSVSTPDGAAVSRLEPDAVPEWAGSSGDCVRVLSGAYGALASPQTHLRAFTLLDVHLRSTVYLDVHEGHAALAYLLSGCAHAVTREQVRRLSPAQACVLHNVGGNSFLQLVGYGQVLILSGLAAGRAFCRPGDLLRPATSTDTWFGPRGLAHGY
jgi:redox-sensitive bicupin YhaK (pirin superfamily)